jgi:hypothetical protein
LAIDVPAALIERLESRGNDEAAQLVGLAAHSYDSMDEAVLHSDNLRLLEPTYLRAATDEGGSGFSGSPAEWRDAREPITDAIRAGGSFLDIGCANGLDTLLWTGESFEIESRPV